MRRSCSDSPLTASQMDGVFGSDSLQGTRSAGRLHVFLRLYTTLPNSFLRALAL